MAISKIVYKSSESATPVTWMDATPATAAAADILAPKTAMLADGVVTTGTGTGGGGSTKARKDVNFYDYDGAIVESYTTAEFADISALPDNPTHTGLTAQGWNMPSNWTLANAKTYISTNKKADWGQMYTTSSGATEIDITLNDPNFLSPWLLIAPNGTVVVDWGDGSTTDTMTGTSNTTLVYQQHVYAQTGNYTIKLTVSSGNFAFYNSSTNYVSVLRTVNAANNRARSRAYSDQITAIRLGAGANIDKTAFSHCYALQSITIPNTVTSIGTYAFYECYALQSITIPNTVTSIGNGTLYSCYALQSIIIPNTVTSAGTYVFANCYALQSITIPNTVTSIGNYAFQYCYALQSIIIPNTVTSIGNYAFQYCYALQSITIPNTVTSIGTYAFAYCYALQSIIIPNTVTSIDNYAFAYCYALQSIIIPNTVTSIGTYAFYYCYTLQSIVIPNTVTSIGIYAFAYCYALQSIIIPNTVTSIDNYAFYYCYALQSITISNTVTSIGNYAFAYCYALQSITIPNTVTTIGTYAFQYCYDILAYHFEATTPPTLASTNVFSNIASNTVIYVPYSADHSVLNAYKTANNWSTYASYMQEEPQ